MPIRITPCSGVRNPAIDSRMLVLPEPDGPNSATTWASIRSWISSVNVPWRREKSRVIGIDILRHQAGLKTRGYALLAKRFETSKAPKAMVADTASIAVAAASWPVSV